MSDSRSFLQETIASLKQQRDQLAVQLHLGKAEVKEEWNRVQQKLDQLSHDYEPVREAIGESAEQVFESLKLVAGEIKDSFKRIHKALTEEKRPS